jgi:hypothetical protein
VVAAALDRRQALPPLDKASLGLEIVLAYARLRLTIRRSDVRRVVAELRAAPGRETAGSELVALRLAHAVQRTLAHIPRHSRCLLQSLVLTQLLARRGISSSLVIAVSPGDEFAAHAWVESDGLPLLPPASGSFAPLVRL